MNSEFALIITCALCVAGILVSFTFFGLFGLLAYVVVGTLASNIQVLKIATFFNGKVEVIQGTVVFCSLFWAFDVMVEFFGSAQAYRALLLSFMSSLLMTLWMILTLWMSPSEQSLEIQGALERIFMPAPALFSASIIAYLCSQGLDIALFSRLKAWTGHRFLWLRGVASTSVGTLIDHLIFSWLAWRLFSPHPVEISLFVRTYLLMGYGFRLLLTFGSPLILYGSYALLPACRWFSGQKDQHKRQTRV